MEAVGGGTNGFIITFCTSNLNPQLTVSKLRLHAKLEFIYVCNKYMYATHFHRFCETTSNKLAVIKLVLH